MGVSCGMKGEAENLQAGRKAQGRQRESMVTWEIHRDPGKGLLIDLKAMGSHW